MLLKRCLLISGSVALALLSAFPEACAQDGRVVHGLKWNEFDAEIDTLKAYDIKKRLSDFDYLIKYVEIRKLNGNVERSGNIFIKGDSLFTDFRSRPTIVGDIFASDPKVTDSTSYGYYKKKIDKKDLKWLRKLGGLKGFYSQNTRLGSKEFYPHNRIFTLVIFNKSGACFGVVSYGPYDIDYQRISELNEDVLRELIDFVF